MPPDGLLTLLFGSLLAALAAGLGPLVHHRLLAWSDALAAGIMLGTAYVVVSIALERTLGQAIAGATLGIFAAYGTHVLLGIGARPVSAVLASAVHSAPEGITMGAAVALAPAFGWFVILTFALHNVSESASITSKLEAAGAGSRRAASLAVGARLVQVLCAVLTFIAISAFPTLLTGALGFAFGALVYLCLAELLPESYHAAGRMSIAVVASIAVGVVALVGEWLH